MGLSAGTRYGQPKEVAGMVGMEHSIEQGKVHYKRDNSLRPAVEIESGDVVDFETDEVTDRQIQPGALASAVTSLEFDRLHPLAGPVSGEGAEPGDVPEA